MTTKLKINTTSGYKRDLKQLNKQGKDFSKLAYVVNKLANGEVLEEKYKDHKLTGYEIPDCRECHIEPDWLLIYRIYKNELILLLVTTGSHSNLFK